MSTCVFQTIFQFYNCNIIYFNIKCQYLNAKITVNLVPRKHNLLQQVLVMKGLRFHRKMKLLPLNFKFFKSPCDIYINRFCSLLASLFLGKTSVLNILSKQDLKAMISTNCIKKAFERQELLEIKKKMIK